MSDKEKTSEVTASLSLGTGDKGAGSGVLTGNFKKASLSGNTTLYSNSNRRGTSNISIKGGGGISFQGNKSDITRSTDFKASKDAVQEGVSGTLFSDAEKSSMDIKGKSVGNRTVGDLNLSVSGETGEKNSASISGSLTGGASIIKTGGHIKKGKSTGISDTHTDWTKPDNTNTWLDTINRGGKKVFAYGGHAGEDATNYSTFRDAEYGEGRSTTTKSTTTFYDKSKGSTKVGGYLSGKANVNVPTGQWKDSGKLSIGASYGTKNAPVSGFGINTKFTKGNFSIGGGYNFKSGQASAGVSYKLPFGKNKK